MRGVRDLRPVWWGALLLGCGGGAFGESVTLRPVADTSLFFAAPGNNLGASDSLAVGGTGHDQAGRGLLRFDVARALPAGALVTSARLEFSVVRAPDGAVASNFEVRRVLRSWGEGKGAGNLGRPAVAGEATWQQRFHPDSPWTGPGGEPGVDFGVVSGGVAVAGLGRYVVDSPGLVEDVRAWLADPAGDHGWVLMSDRESAALSARRVATREHADPAAVAALVIEYTTAPPAGPVLGAWGVVEGRFRFEFAGVPGNLYEVQAREGWETDAAWSAFTNVVVKLLPTIVVVTDPVPVAAGKGFRVYRVADVGDVD